MRPMSDRGVTPETRSPSTGAPAFAVRDRDSRARGRGAWIAGGLSLALYLSTHTSNLSVAHDGIRYMMLIEGGRVHLHPHHLLATPVAQAWLCAWRTLAGGAGVDVDSHRVVSVMNALAAAAIVALFYALLRSDRRVGAALAAGVTALVASSYGVWLYATTAETYAAPLALVMSVLVILARDRPSPRRFAVAGAVHGVAVLLHQMHVLLLPAIALLALLAARPAPRPARAARRALGAHLGVFATIVIAGYAAALWALRIDSLDAATAYLAGYAVERDYWHALGPSTLVRAGVGAVRAVIGGQFVLADPVARDLAISQLGGLRLEDEAFAVRAMPVELARALVAVALAAAVALGAIAAVAARRVVRVRRAGGARSQHPACPGSARAPVAAVWLVSYAAFFSLWVPHNLEFWVVQCLAAAWLLAIATAAHGGRWMAPAIGAVAAAVLGVNLLGSVFPLRARESDYYREAAAGYVAHTGPGDLVVVSDAWILSSHLARSGRVRVLSLDQLARRADSPGAIVAELGRELDAVLRAGHRVAISRSAVAVGGVARPRAAVRAAVAEALSRYARSGREVREVVDPFVVIDALPPASAGAAPIAADP